MSVDVNKAVVRRYFEAAEAAARNDRWDALDEVADPDLTIVVPGWPEMRGRENIKEVLAPVFGAFSDFWITVEEMVGEGESVAARWSRGVTAKVALPLHGGIIVPAGKTLTWASVGVFRLRAGKIVEERTEMDWLAVLEQLGIAPAAT